MSETTMKHRFLSLLRLVTAGTLALGLSLPATAATEHTAKVKSAIADLQASANKIGAPKIEGEDLFFGSAKVNGNFDIVDGLKARHGGTATLFVRKGDAFIRVSTNVMRDGKRAVGTQLDPNGPAIAAIRKGTGYYGVVDILGKLFDTAYEPIRSAKGDVIGIYYVGYPLE